MNRSLIAIAIFAAGILNSGATLLFNDSFDSYSDGDLVSQGPWVQTGVILTTYPVQVSSGKALLGATGQDVNAPLYSTIMLEPSTTFGISLTINVSNAKNIGDYFMNWTAAPGDLLSRSCLYIKASPGGGFLLGYLEAGIMPLINYGSQALSLGQDYNVLIKYKGAAGQRNDTAEVFVNNALYLSDTWNAPYDEAKSLGVIHLRQGSTTAAPTLSVDNLRVEVVPEPGTASLLAMGIAGLLYFRRRK